MTFSLWISGLLLISLTGAHGLDYFPENLVVAKENDVNPIKLTCGTTTKETVTWKHKGEELDEDSVEEGVELNGSDLILSKVETPLVGEYSCWRGEKMLSSFHVLLEKEEAGELESFMSCRAKSYNCSFSCTWNRTGYAAVRLGLGHDCRQGLKSCQWLGSSSKKIQNGAFQFELPHSLSPYAEESSRLELTAEAISINNQSVLRRNKNFYLRDIIQPDSPKIVRCQAVDQELNVTIEPPSTWSAPHSFFTLENEIEYRLKDDDKRGRSSSTLIPKGISQLRVRCRDPLVVSAWSQWTPWKNVRTGREVPCQSRKKGGKKNRKKKQEKRKNQDAGLSQAS
ncbi:interleukin-12 subunit beta isoform X2 [Stegastes partitus]|uniref:Interleukin-12 subunit beta n=1 Tax=Stegastes partitus TaxID=144197 RepID=A0A9Y4N337_9TELE|nr:PREDICTED: interleukin-12 subunit beta-like isoform X2 [Stegastes partitus]